MKHDVFISYASQDKPVADAVCSTLEHNGIRCWIAPRDIFPGSDWAQSITNAIKSGKIMVLIFSQNSNGSSQVAKELNLAISHNLVIVPFKIDNSMPSGSMEYFLADMHWLDAIDGNMQEQIDKLTEVIQSVLPHRSEEPPVPSPDPNSAPAPELASQLPPHPIENAPYVDTPKSKVGFLQAYKMFWKNSFRYRGCATRSEFWKAVLIHLVVGLLIGTVDYALGIDIFSSCYMLASLFPSIALCVRRLHDTNRSGHWMWLFFTVYGNIALLVFFCLKSKTANNRFCS